MGGPHSIQGTQRGDPSKMVVKVVDVVKEVSVAKGTYGDARNVANGSRRSSSDTVEMREDIEDVTGLARG